MLIEKTINKLKNYKAKVLSIFIFMTLSICTFFYGSYLVYAEKIIYYLDNGISMASTFFGSYGGAEDNEVAGTADGGNLSPDGQAYWGAINRYLDLGRLRKFGAGDILIFKVDGNWAGNVYFYVSENGSNWYSVGSVNIPQNNTGRFLNVYGESLPIKDIRYVRAESSGQAIDWFGFAVSTSDETPPQVKFNPSSATTNSNVNLVVTPEDSGRGVEKYRYRISSNNGSTWGGWSSYIKASTSPTYSTSFSSQGQYKIQVEAIDYVDNIITSTSGTYTIDKTAPNGAITNNPTNGLDNYKSRTLTFTGTDTGGSGFKNIKLPNGSFVSGNTANYTITANGTYTFEGYDNAGNSVTKSITVNNIDNVPPIFKSLNIENVTEAGFDIVVDLYDDNSGIRDLSLAIWRGGNYVGMQSIKDFNVSNGIKRYHVDMSFIGAGADYVYIGKHATDNAGNNIFAGDVPFKLDSTAPNLNVFQPSTAWTPNPTIIRANMSDNFNGIEKVSISGPGLSKTTRNTFSKPKVLSLLTQDGNRGVLAYIKEQGYDITYKTDITSVNDFAGYDIILYDGAYFMVNGFNGILNEAYNKGYRILTFGNDTNEEANIHPVISAYHMANTNHHLIQYMNQGGNVGELYNRGDSDNLMKYYDGKTEEDNSMNLVSSYPSDTRPIAMNSLDPTSPSILYSVNNNGGKWLHFQIYDNNGYVTNRAIDELMLGTMAKRMSYTEDFTVTENGVYTIETEDFFGNITTKQINVTNIDTTIPTITLTPSTTSWTNANVDINVNTSDSQSGVKQIKLPNGTIVSGVTSTKFTATENGTYTFEVMDNVGHKTTKSIAINNIDKVAPTLNLTPSTTSWTNKSVTITVNGADIGGSAIKNIKLPNGTFVTGSSTNYNVSANGTFDFEISDNAGSVVKKSITINNIDTTMPNVTLTQSTSSWTNNNIVISLTSSDTQSGIKEIKLPNGNIVNSSNTTYTATNIGTYTFEVTDNVGNKTVKSITISNIDKKAPSLNLSTNTNLITDSSITISAEAFDGESGVKSIKLPNGTIVNGSTATYSVSENGSYTFESTDNVGNKTSSTININNIIKINPVSGIDRIEYKLEGATIKDWTTYNGIFNVVNEGITTIKARAIDKAGNVSNEATSFVKIDRSKPINGTVEIIIK